MSIKLVYGPSEEYPAAVVRAVDRKYSAVAGFLQSDLDMPFAARDFAKEIREVMAGKRPPFQGSGDGFFTRVEPATSQLGLDIGEPPKTISVSTADLLAAVEEWADHLEKTKKWPEWALKGPGTK